jgi:hypothetical protein
VQEYLLNLLSFSEVHSQYGHVFYCSDIDSLPSVDLLLGSYWAEMQPDNYVLNYGGNLCGLCFQKSATEQEITLGHSLLMGYYTVHDMD